jgi:uncharacterized protein (DUF1800 family)
MSALEAAIAANRFGLGARPGELARLGEPRAWLAAQVRAPAPFVLAQTDLPTSADAARTLAAYRDRRQERRDARADEAPEADAAQQAVTRLAPLLAQEVDARAARALTTDDHFAERLVYFWSNHFTVAATKLVTIPFAGPFEREAIRPNLTGSFTDLTLAVARHPGMLLYLDQAQSVGPNSQLGARRERGLNENLAREMLELHTLGVDGGYTQGDVAELARALTGWTMAGDRFRRFRGNAAPGSFVFVPQLHEPGARTVLGRRYSDDGEGQARAIIADLCRHPAAARHIATKLARHFIADDPPREAVVRLERAFRDTEGDLPSLHRALIDCPEAWAPQPAKFRTPNDFLLAALRAADVRDVPARAMLGGYAQLGQPAFRAPSPQGWDDVAASWAGPDAVLRRVEWCQALAQRLGASTRPEQLAAEALGPMLTPHTRQAVARAESVQQGMVLALMSPEFQRR